MCDWEEFIFGCNCSVRQLKSYCHFARNDPYHQCFSVKVLRKVWDVAEPCDNCASSRARAAMQASQAGSWGQGYAAQEQNQRRQ